MPSEVSAMLSEVSAMLSEQGRSQDFSTGGATFSIAERSEAFVLQGTRSVPSARLTNCGAWGAAPAGSRGRAPGGGLGGRSPPDFF